MSLSTIIHKRHKSIIAIQAFMIILSVFAFIFFNNTKVIAQNNVTDKVVKEAPSCCVDAPLNCCQ